MSHAALPPGYSVQTRRPGKSETTQIITMPMHAVATLSNKAEQAATNAVSDAWNTKKNTINTVHELCMNPPMGSSCPASAPTTTAMII